MDTDGKCLYIIVRWIPTSVENKSELPAQTNMSSLTMAEHLCHFQLHYLE